MKGDGERGRGREGGEESFVFLGYVGNIFECGLFGYGVRVV